MLYKGSTPLTLLWGMGGKFTTHIENAEKLKSSSNTNNQISGHDQDNNRINIF